jgi:hypothetical protein
MTDWRMVVGWVLSFCLIFGSGVVLLVVLGGSVSAQVAQVESGEGNESVTGEASSDGDSDASGDVVSAGGSSERVLADLGPAGHVYAIEMGDNGEYAEVFINSARPQSIVFSDAHGASADVAAGRPGYAWSRAVSLPPRPSMVLVPVTEYRGQRAVTISGAGVDGSVTIPLERQGGEPLVGGELDGSDLYLPIGLGALLGVVGLAVLGFRKRRKKRSEVSEL